MCTAAYLRVYEVDGAHTHAHLLQLVDNVAHDGDVGVSVAGGGGWK